MYAPKDKQLEGMKFVLEQIGLKEYCRTLERLCAHKFISKAEMYRRIKMARHLLGISYEDYIKNYR